jgi:hypothetical protein
VTVVDRGVPTSWQHLHDALRQTGHGDPWRDGIESAVERARATGSA